MNPKEWAQSKRKHRFASARDVRRCNPNGHTVRRTINKGIHRNGSVKKVLKNISNNDVQTGFEDSLGFNMKVDTLYSLNRHKRWSHMDEHITHSRCDEVWDVESGHLGYGETGRSNSVADPRAFLGYFDVNELEETFQLRFGKRKNRLDVLGDTARVNRATWLMEQEQIPKNVRSPRIVIRKFQPSSISKHCRVQKAHVNAFGQLSFWAPKQIDESADYLDVDLGDVYEIEAISTRGRPLRRDRIDGYQPAPGWPREWVKKYKLFYRLDRADLWIQYGDVWNGNTDSETEVVHKVNDLFHPSVGLKARYLRFQPLSLREDGFAGRKALRIGVYGKCCATTSVEDAVVRAHKTKHGRKGLSRKAKRKMKDRQLKEERRLGGERLGVSNGEDGTEERSVDWRAFASVDHQMTDHEVNGVVICVSFGSQQKHWGYRNADGVFCQGCGMCRSESRQVRMMRKQKRRALKKRTREQWKYENCL